MPLSEKSFILDKIIFLVDLVDQISIVQKRSEYLLLERFRKFTNRTRVCVCYLVNTTEDSAEKIFQKPNYTTEYCVLMNWKILDQKVSNVAVSILKGNKTTHPFLLNMLLWLDSGLEVNEKFLVLSYYC